jgi:hypothetical protein
LADDRRLCAHQFPVIAAAAAPVTGEIRGVTSAGQPKPLMARWQGSQRRSRVTLRTIARSLDLGVNMTLSQPSYHALKRILEHHAAETERRAAVPELQQIGPHIRDIEEYHSFFENAQHRRDDRTTKTP